MATHTLSAQVDLLRTLPGMGKLPLTEATALVGWGIFRAFMPGTAIPISHQVNSQCYLIIEGSVDTLVLDRDGRQVSLGVLGAGEMFGNSSLFINRSLLSTARTCEQVFALQWSVEKLREKRGHIPIFMHMLEASYTQRRIISTLSRVPLFSGLEIADRRMLAAYLTRHDFERSTVIFEQGSPGKALYLIEQGQITVEQNSTIVASLGEGDFFGEMALLSDAPHNATIHCITPARCLQLPGEVFRSLMVENPSLETGLHAVIDARLRHAERVHNDETHRLQLQVAVTRGMLRGSHILVRRPALCPPGCQICEEACASRFGQTRLHLNGARVDEWDVTTSCRQCRVGAECVEACPEEAIVWDENGALRITEACTGCGECVPACPYNAMETMHIRVEERGGPLWALWRRMRSDAEPAAGTQVASKCDLCAGYADRACLSQCPTGSLQLMSIEELFPL
ncbi:MAG: cyclic nucleotide-binding domain-containing protein [Herpetosiphonaceae bacterium]|nr:cyclic nucleotide-binding domain-containing protein [Herpetosiphonaceae bacterium]